MKNIIKISYSILLVIFLSFFLNSCDDLLNDDDVAEGSLDVSCKALSGENISVNELSVQLHHNANYDNLYESKTSSANNSESKVVFDNIENGKYYLMAWKDNDNDSYFSSGDYFGFAETPLFFDGSGKSLTLWMYELD